MLQCRVGSVLSSVFKNANTHLSEIFYFNISEFQIYSKYYHLSSKNSNFVSMLHASQHQCSNMQAFHYFCVLLLQSKHNNIKTTLQRGCFQVVILLSTDKIKRSKIAGDSMAKVVLLQAVSNASWYQPDNELMTNICAIFFQ